MESAKTGIVLKENPLYDNSDSASSKSKKETHHDVMSVMMVDITAEAAMAEMERKVSFLMKVMKEQDHEITALREQMRTRKTAESSQTPVVKATDKGKNVVQENQPQQQSVSVASLSVQQLDDMIANSIRAQYGGPPQTTFMYSKPYTKRIDNLRMPLGGDQLVRQFVRSLKGNAFEWYTDLEPEVINSWEQLEKEFLNRFYSTRRTVSMMKLTNIKQQKGKSVIDYINQWRALSLDYKDRLTELSAAEMCTQGMHWGFLYILQEIKPRTFEELTTRAHDIELTIASRGTKDFPVPEVRKDKKETKSAEKRPEQAGKVDDPNCCKYHRVISHPVEKCFVLKEHILRLACEKKIELDLEEFETFEPVVVQFHQEVAPKDSREKERSIEEDGEGWIVDKNPRVVACHAINAMEEENIPLRLLEEEEVSKDIARFNVDDLLSLPQETKTILINVLLNSAASSSSAPTVTYESTSYFMSIDFSDEDLLLGSKLHNRPLYVSGYVREQRVDRILIDNGSAVNIMPKLTMRQLDILMDELSNSKLVIQGFNQGSQRVIGMIRLELIIGGLKASALFHVIDSKTTYKLLLDRPWIHGNGVVTSTVDQCFKFYQDGIKKVEVDPNPFSEVESHFADAKFYLKNDNSPEVVPVEIPLVNREDNL
ncbi:ty3-gypsy retrotransposon protein [Cucumis melo var. makuwa]|uniref:Ty3-gypsy retrotransposon protein n=1 Tax=Cucumis melo var. makuwa TaxID=1194695 RepID=A0A5D3DV71_CUCMM|nr:ty3-gypsy retrotransposon protein [Cucumis melo var. makuwa]TYK27626.1 ty3-gypsy retrotransposon protein [Cucumis melo var. makuwa]